MDGLPLPSCYLLLQGQLGGAHMLQRGPSGQWGGASSAPSGTSRDLLCQYATALQLLAGCLSAQVRQQAPVGYNRRLLLATAVCAVALYIVVLCGCLLLRLLLLDSHVH